MGNGKRTSIKIKKSPSDKDGEKVVMVPLTKDYSVSREDFGRLSEIVEDEACWCCHQKECRCED